jgi:deazaflavin-dependent oxidoreductase (nitroreductase family)
VGTPIGGWMLLMRTVGRKSGLRREVPLSYLVADGSAWVMAGFGGHCDWYQNVRADAQVEVVLPGRTVACRAEEVIDGDVRRRIIPQLVRATGVPGFLTGCDPYHATPEQLLAATEWVPLIRLRPLGAPLVAGPDDPGGWGWVWRQGVVLALVAAVVGRLRRHRPGGAASPA